MKELVPSSPKGASPNKDTENNMDDVDEQSSVGGPDEKALK